MRNLTDHNTALLGKALWQLHEGTNKLWVQALDNKYLHGGSCLTSSVRQHASPVWKGLMKARERLRGGFKFKVGNGMTSVWYQDWSGHGKLADHLDFVHISDTALRLHDLIQNGTWCFDKLYTVLTDEVKSWFLAVSPSQVSDTTQDAWIWDGSNNGTYSVSDGYAWLQNQNVHEDPVDWTWIWKLRIPEKIRVFVWSCLHEALPTNAKRHGCNLAPNPSCTRCSADREDILHVLRDCPLSRQLWGKLGTWRWPNFWNQNLQAWILSHAHGEHASRFLVGLWNVWKWRCNACLDPHPWSLEGAWRKLCHEFDEIARALNDDSVDVDVQRMKDGWQPPQQSFLKLNVDGSFREDRKSVV